MFHLEIVHTPFLYEETIGQICAKIRIKSRRSLVSGSRKLLIMVLTPVFRRQLRIIPLFKLGEAINSRVVSTGSGERLTAL